MIYTVQKTNFSIKDFFSKCDQMWSNLLKKSLMEKFIFCAVLTTRRISDFVINYLSNSQESDGRKTKRHDFRRNFFILNFFDTFGNLEIDFGINRSRCF